MSLKNQRPGKEVLLSQTQPHRLASLFGINLVSRDRAVSSPGSCLVVSSAGVGVDSLARRGGGGPGAAADCERVSVSVHVLCVCVLC